MASHPSRPTEMTVSSVMRVSEELEFDCESSGFVRDRNSFWNVLVDDRRKRWSKVHAFWIWMGKTLHRVLSGDSKVKPSGHYTKQSYEIGAANF